MSPQEREYAEHLVIESLVSGLCLYPLSLLIKRRWESSSFFLHHPLGLSTWWLTIRNCLCIHPSVSRVPRQRVNCHGGFVLYRRWRRANGRWLFIVVTHDTVISALSQLSRVIPLNPSRTRSSSVCQFSSDEVWHSRNHLPKKVGFWWSVSVRQDRGTDTLPQTIHITEHWKNTKKHSKTDKDCWVIIPINRNSPSHNEWVFCISSNVWNYRNRNSCHLRSPPFLRNRDLLFSLFLIDLVL